MSAALHLKPWDDRRLTLAMEHTGRKAGTTAGSYIDDLVAQKKTVILCTGCSPKFASAANGYATRKSMPICAAKCDGCREDGMDRRLFVHHQNMPR